MVWIKVSDYITGEMSDEPAATVDEAGNQPDKQEVVEGVKCEGQGKESESGENGSANGANNADYEKHISYTADGTAVYTDPTTKTEYVFDQAKNQWVPKDAVSEGAKATNPYETEHYRWCTETHQWILKEGADKAPTTECENEHYKWNAETNSWEAKNGDQRFATSVFKDGQHLFTDSDGVVFFWDEEKKAWFPKIDDDFMAMYQTSYGFIDNTSTAAMSSATQPTAQTTATPDAEEPQKPAVKRKPNPAQWFDESPEHCTKVYVSNLPDDITEEEFVEVMSKCGMIFRDPNTKKNKVKLYAEKGGQLKGDGLVHYMRVESVKLAIDMLDGYDVRGRKIKVQRAQFQMRGEYNPSLKPKKKKQDKEKMKKMQEKLLDWRPDKMRGERSKHERVVIIKNLFEPQIFENHFDLIIDYTNNLREECTKCGTVRKVVVYSSEAEGVAEVRMSDPEEADLVVQMMHRRLFGKRELRAELWDGKTKFKVQETTEENTQRLSKWNEFLEQDDDDENPSAEATATEIPSETKTAAEKSTEAGS